MLKKFLLIASLLMAPLPLAAELGDDGLHKAPWMRDTFKDLREDLEEANAEGRRLMVIVEQRGCIYCRKMYEEVFVIPEIEQLLAERFFVVQINMFGDVEVTDFDGTVLPEKDMVKRWGALFTPTIYFFPQDVPEGVTAAQAAVATMPGAFGRWTTFNLLNWVLEKGYDGDEPFQKYHARKFEAQRN
ncbi:Thioredoxin-like domain-containing protein [Ruegeria intermedia]|uniref:Thioredoxin-like domain-containing protein n=1 Tax=Ruegeria intermedia TaxID=996115 RepID=A0A1M4W1V2_9RHOB|nr:thioredoxin family protein [Ruegeria intermedia]SHE75130.1 Thioredoxin-like domain-containing protein [Ruegeria intermedia]